MTRTALILLLGWTIFSYSPAWGQEDGAALDSTEHQAMAETLAYAMEYGRTGQENAWVNPDSGHSGAVVPVNTYVNEEGLYCREYTQTILIGGREEQGYGTACRQPDGTWLIVDEEVPAPAAATTTYHYVYRDPYSSYYYPWVFYEPLLYPHRIFFSFVFVRHSGHFHHRHFHDGHHFRSDLQGDHRHFRGDHRGIRRDHDRGGRHLRRDFDGRDRRSVRGDRHFDGHDRDRRSVTVRDGHGRRDGDRRGSLRLRSDRGPDRGDRHLRDHDRDRRSVTVRDGHDRRGGDRHFRQDHGRRSGDRGDRHLRDRDRSQRNSPHVRSDRNRGHGPRGSLTVRGGQTVRDQAGLHGRQSSRGHSGGAHFRSQSGGHGGRSQGSGNVSRSGQAFSRR